MSYVYGVKTCNKVTCKCDDCGNVQKMYMVDFSKRSRPHCSKCGSVNLYPTQKRWSRA